MKFILNSKAIVLTLRVFCHKDASQSRLRTISCHSVT